MIIFLYGKDSYRSRQKLNEIIDHYKKIHKSGLSLKVLDGDELDIEDVRNEVQTISMFKEKKLLAFKNICNSKKEDGLLDVLKSLKDTDDIVLVYEEEAGKKSSLFKFLIKYAKVQEFELLTGEKLKSWIKKEFSIYNTEISSVGLNKLIEYTGGDTWQLSNEIKKLVSFKGKKRIEPEDVEILVKPKIEADIFKTIDAIAIKDKKRALKLIHKHLEKGDNPVYLLTMINFQFRNILIIKDLADKYIPYSSILKITKLHPFVVKKSLEQSKQFSLQELKKIYQKIFQVDLAIKTGRVEAKHALDLLIIEI